MRWSVARLIAGKEFRDLLRDRRTVMLILVLPALLYPLFGISGYLFAASLMAHPAVVGISGAEFLPKAESGLPAFVVNGKFADGLDVSDETAGGVLVKPITIDADEALRTKQVDVVLTISPNFLADLNSDDRKPTLKIQQRDGDEKSKLTAKRLVEIVHKWESQLRELRFAKKGLKKDFDQIFTIEDPQTDKPKGKKAADELRDTFSKVFPFILIMWLVTGAIQPAVDMTAGEKERGTMETLLISPAERSEIVVGKFLATTVFAFGSVVWNVIWLSGAGLIIEGLLGFPIVNKVGLISCVVLGLPQAMFFSAVCLALGIYAKSTKEGQYYLMPMILFTMPLAFWSMLPGTELSPWTCWVPVTGPMLLQSRLLSVSTEPIPWEYFAPVLGSATLWVSIALWLAVRQFKNEAVLFRETGPTKGGGLMRKLFSRPRPR